MDKLAPAFRAAGLDPAAAEPLPAGPGEPPAWRVVVHGRDAQATWTAFRDHAELTGYWPVIMGEAKEAERLFELFEPEGPGSGAILAAAARTDPATWLGERPAELGVEQDPAEAAQLRGTWPATPLPYHELTVHLDVLSRRPLERVAIGLFRLAEGEERQAGWGPEIVFARLRYGGWNECPPPEVHVALHRLWRERHGAVPVAASFDVVECRVPRPPADQAGALALAEQQYLYCPDVVWQGAGTIAALAGGLLGGSTWYFWWD